MYELIGLVFLVGLSLADYQWSWAGGLIGGNIPTLNSFPGARSSPMIWQDSKNNIWLFGGKGIDSNEEEAFLNDLWKSQNNGLSWQLVSGSVSGNKAGSYGRPQIASPQSFPGGRTESAHWIDPNDNLWIFGGNGNGNDTTVGYLNDLWMFNGVNWAWMGGSSIPNDTGKFGLVGQGSPSNIPSARTSAAVFLNQRVYIFGGTGIDSQGNLTAMNDLWSFDGQNWTWLTGSNIGGSAGIYGTQGQAAQGNTPSGRDEFSLWTDASGNLWLFGGTGSDEETEDFFNDVWMYSTSSLLWTWVTGANAPNQQGSYFTQGQPNPLSFPGARSRQCISADKSGNAWVFGGSYVSGEELYFNDAWSFNVTTNTWTWWAGNSTNELGNYGIFKQPSPLNHPGGRKEASCWLSSGNYYFFGGFGTGFSEDAFFNDVWALALVSSGTSFNQGTSLSKNPNPLPSSNSENIGPTQANPFSYATFTALIVVTLLLVLVLVGVITFCFVTRRMDARKYLEMEDKR